MAAPPAAKGEPCEVAFEGEFDAEWRNRVQESYQKALKKNCSIDQFYDFTGRNGKLVPKNEIPYDLAKLHAAGGSGQAQLIDLGYELKKDAHGSEALVPPSGITTLFATYGNRMRAAIARGEIGENDKIVPVFVLVRKGSEVALSSHWDDYRFVDPLTDSFPSIEEFVLLDHRMPQFPDNIWHQVLAEGKIPFPMRNFIFHDSAHLSEFNANPALMKATRDWYRRALSLPAVWSKSDPKFEDVSIERLRNRVFTVTEFFSVPDITQTTLIESIFPGLLARPDTSELFDRVKVDLSSRSTFELDQLVAQIEVHVERLFVRMGGGMRDGYGFDKFNNPLNRARTGMELARTNPQEIPEDIYGYWTSKARPSADESLFGLLTEIRELLSFVDDKRELFHQTHNSRPRFSGTEQDFILKIRESAVDRLARFEVAIYRAVKLQLTPQQIVADSLQVMVDPNSATYRYLDSFLPAYSYLRDNFL